MHTPFGTNHALEHGALIFPFSFGVIAVAVAHQEFPDLHAITGIPFVAQGDRAHMQVIPQFTLTVVRQGADQGRCRRVHPILGPSLPVSQPDGLTLCRDVTDVSRSSQAVLITVACRA